MIGQGGLLRALSQIQGQSNENENTERLRKLYEAIRDLNNTLVDMEKNYSVYIKNIKKKDIKVISIALKDVLTDLVNELKNVNNNLKKLTTTTGLVSVAFSGGADKILNDLAGEVDKLSEFIQELMKKYMDVEVENKT